MKSEDLLVSMVEDIISYCTMESCFAEEEDEHGRTYITNVCPFLDKEDDVWTARCLIGDPLSWRI